MLSHVDPNSVSMVIMEQLPLVVSNCENGCLLPDKLLYSFSPSGVTEDYVSSQVHPANRDLWNNLYEHFVLLIRFRSMARGTIADRFAVLLIADDSPYEEKVNYILKSFYYEFHIC